VVVPFSFATSFSRCATTWAFESVALVCACFGLSGDKSEPDRERVFDLFGRKGMGVDGRDERNCTHQHLILSAKQGETYR
jgi:hypothetical protein